MIDFSAVECVVCKHVVLDATEGLFKGMVRVVCPNKKCRRRNWVACDGNEMRVVFVDRPPARIE